MIDRDKVARAIWESPLCDQPPGFERRTWPPTYPGVKGEFLTKADAAIAAVLSQLREPNHDVTAAVVPPGEDRTEAVRMWKAMLEAAFLQPQESATPAE